MNEGVLEGFSGEKMGLDHSFGHCRGGLQALPYRAGINPAPYGHIGRNNDQSQKMEYLF